jgi:hypothetical protein
MRGVKRAVAATLVKVLPRGLLVNPDLFLRWEERGVHVVPVHFYEPIPDLGRLSSSVWTSYELEMPDVADGLLRMQPHDLAQLEGRHGFKNENSYFASLDALALYAFVREQKPATIVEVGSGMSTRIALAALEDNGTGRLITIEPYETERMPNPPTFAVPVQEAPLAVFDSLQPSDILFIDSSHVSKVGSDVNHLILRVLPRLAHGVLVHFHDIYLPDEYPEALVQTKHRFWNEQYLLHAYLIGNSRTQILWSSHHAATRSQPQLADALGSRRWYGGSIWLRV